MQNKKLRRSTVARRSFTEASCIASLLPLLRKVVVLILFTIASIKLSSHLALTMDQRGRHFYLDIILRNANEFDNQFDDSTNGTLILRKVATILSSRNLAHQRWKELKTFAFKTLFP